MMEALTRHLLGPGHSVSVGSAGVHGLEGQAIHPLAASALAERSVDSSDFVARQLRPEWVGSADLTVTADRWHRDLLLEYVPDAYGRLFTLREFASLLAGSQRSGLADVASLARVADERRRVAARGVPSEVDLADPIGRDLPAFRECLGRVNAAVSLLVQALR